MNRARFICRLVAIGLTLAAGGAEADPALLAAVQAELYAGRTAEAAAIAETRVAQIPGDNQARFALGAARFLQAVEHLGQALHRYGLRTSDGPSFAGLAGLPLLRIPVPENPDPEMLTYDAFRGVLAAFVADLEAAEATLAEVTDGEVQLPLNIGLIRLDLDGDGTGTDDEALWRIFVEIAGATWLNEETARLLLTDFDAADVPWLRAYCHLLMAIGEFPLAHDWKPAFETTFQRLFPKAGLPAAALNLAPAAGERANFASIADLVAFIHLNHWPVVEPERMQSVLAHLEAVPRLSRESWRLIEAETDDANEWIPSPKQTGVLVGMAVTQEQIDAWMLFLDELEALLQGRKLLPHWRFEQGINLRRMFLEPTTFDIVLLIQGSAALPYLEDGELSARDTWRRIIQLFGADFFRYAVWFN